MKNIEKRESRKANKERFYQGTSFVLFGICITLVAMYIALGHQIYIIASLVDLLGLVAIMIMSWIEPCYTISKKTKEAYLSVEEFRKRELKQTRARIDFLESDIKKLSRGFEGLRARSVC